MEALVSIIIPTYNAARYLETQLKALLSQSIQPAEIIIIDSSSSDRTLAIARRYPVEIVVIGKEEFDHGSTRTLGGMRSTANFLVYLTQDAIPCDPNSVGNLLEPMLSNPTIAAVYGRQLPQQAATPFARHLRLFNYPEHSYIRTFADKERYGLRTTFCSNSFAAYQRSVLNSLGWFKAGLILGEDMEVCARLLLKGYSIGYAADACVYHSHNYTPWEDFKRYYDTGVFHATEHQLLEEFGRPGREGLEYARSEVEFLLANRLYSAVPLSFLRSSLKFLGYKLGRRYSAFPSWLNAKFSMRGKNWNWSNAKTLC